MTCVKLSWFVYRSPNVSVVWFLKAFPFKAHFDGCNDKRPKSILLIAHLPDSTKLCFQKLEGRGMHSITVDLLFDLNWIPEILFNHVCHCTRPGNSPSTAFILDYTGTRHKIVFEGTDTWKFCHLMLVHCEFVIFMVNGFEGTCESEHVHFVTMNRMMLMTPKNFMLACIQTEHGVHPFSQWWAAIGDKSFRNFRVCSWALHKRPALTLAGSLIATIKWQNFRCAKKLL